MKKIERKLNSFFRKYQNGMTFTAIPFIVLAIVLKHMENLPATDFVSFSNVASWIESTCHIEISGYIGILSHIGMLCFIVATLLCGIPIIFRAVMALKWKTISIELLVTIAVAGAITIGEFSECAIVTFLFQFGNFLEAQTLKKTRSAIKDLVAFAPQTAIRKNGNELEEIDVDEIEVDDLLLVREGAKVGVDGVILSGEGFFNEANITGESKPVHKKEGDFLYAGSVLESGLVDMTASRVGDDTTYAKIIELVEEAEDAKSPVERFIDRFAKYYTPFVILAAALVFVVTRDVDTSVTVLVLACPGALVIGAPIASVSGIGKGAKNGILFKGGDVMHTFARSDAFLFDKTGTLTYGNTRVSSYFNYSSDEEKYLKLVAEIEKTGTHPLGKALIAHVEDKNYEASEGIIEVQVVKGQGMIGVADEEAIFVGNELLMENNEIYFSDAQRKACDTIRKNGESLVIAATRDGIQFVFGISDIIREGVSGAMKQLRKMNDSELVMLTGDHADTAVAIGKKVGIENVRANLLPEDKYRILEEYQQNNKRVCFVGDGINDSPSITKADTGIAMGSGTDIAIECSDIVILNSRVSMIPEALKLAKKTVAVTTENIIIAVGTVILLLIGLFMGFIHMSSGMLIHELSILVVIFNGMRLLLHRDSN